MPNALSGIGVVVEEEFQFPADIKAALRTNQRAWENFQRYSGSYQRIRVAYVDVAKTTRRVQETA